MDTSQAPMNHDYDADSGSLTPRGGATPDGGNNPAPVKGMETPGIAGQLGGMAGKAARAIGGRQSQIDNAVDEASR